MAKKYINLSKEELLKLVEKQDKELATKKYGLVWDSEKEPEQVVLDCEKNIPILKRDKTKEIRTDNSDDNIMIEGDNYHALTCLNYTHKGKIDVIYIDPPYNTGNKTEWKYNDKYIDDNDGYRHSKWLNMMEKRLLLAKNLLKDGASIFISIGDDEHANLKLLCDKIFGRQNFITSISRIAKTASNLGKFFAPSCDYILLYTKSVETLKDDSFAQDVNDDLFKKEDELGKYRDDIAFYQSSLKDLRPNQRYFVECPDGSLVIPPGQTIPETKQDAEVVLQKDGDKRWRWSVETYLQQKDMLVFKETKTSPLLDENGDQAKYNIYTKSYLKDRQETGVKPRNFLIEKEFLNRKGADYIKKIGINFNYSKPKALIHHLIDLSNADNKAIILDFFAGSGTTGEVVLDLNNEDGGKRNFILCTNNEVGYKEESAFIKKNNLTKEDFKLLEKNPDKKYLDFLEKNGVATSVCYPRLKSIINGYKEVSKNAPLIKGLNGNLQYFKTDLIPVQRIDNVEDRQRRELTEKAGQMIAIKENTFEEVEICEWFQIFENKDKSRKTAIYFREDMDEFDSLVKKLGKTNTILYIFSYGRIDKKLFKYLEKNITIEDIPEPILEIYKEINLTIKDK